LHRIAAIQVGFAQAEAQQGIVHAFGQHLFQCLSAHRESPSSASLVSIVGASSARESQALETLREQSSLLRNLSFIASEERQTGLEQALDVADVLLVDPEQDHVV